MIAIAQEWQIDLEHLGKRKPKQVQTVRGPTKRPKMFDQRARGQQARGQYSTCGKLDNIFN